MTKKGPVLTPGPFFVPPSLAPQEPLPGRTHVSQPDPRLVFPDFYGNPVISAIADVPRWTVSDNEKMPINMRELVFGLGRVWGAHEISEQCLFTLDEMTQHLPQAANNAFYLRAQTDGFLVLDIEKTCPPELAQRLLTLPNLYSELSMSGRGYHLVLPLPSNFWDYPIASGKKVLQHDHGHYEILLDHWVTFTRSPVPRATLPATDYRSGLWEEIYAELAKDAVEAPTAEFDLGTERPDIPRREQIIELMTRRPLEKSLEDFRNDYSRFEYSTLGVLFNRLRTILVAIHGNHGTTYDEAAMSWLLFEAATQVLPYRDKHDEHRNGIPLLLNAAVSLVARRLADSGGTERSK